MARRRGLSRWLLPVIRPDAPAPDPAVVGPTDDPAVATAPVAPVAPVPAVPAVPREGTPDKGWFGAEDGPKGLAQRAAELLAGMGPLQLPARQVDDGLPGGQHRSWKRGGGVEFSEHKEYAPGDDLRHLDWKAWARTDRYYLKRYEQEVHAALTLVLDASASMGLADARDGDKFDTVRLVLAALALVLVRQGDAVGLCVIGRPDLNVAAGSSLRHYAVLADRLERLKPEGQAGLDAFGASSWQGLDRRGLCVVASDVLLEPDRALAPLHDLRRAGLDVLLLHALHPRERDLDFGAPAWLQCPESADRRLTDPRLVRHAYARLMAAHCDALRVACGFKGVGYLGVDTGQDPRGVVRGVLRTTARLVRRRGVGVAPEDAWVVPAGVVDGW